MKDNSAKPVQTVRKRRRGLPVLIIFVINILVLGLLQWRYDWIQYLSPDQVDTTIHWVKNHLDALGMWAPLFVVLIGTLLVPANFVSYPTILVCVALYGWALGGLLILIIFFLGISLVYAIAQHLGRATVETYFAKGIQMVNRRLSGRPLVNVIITRLVVYMNPLANWIICASDIGYRNIVVGTLIGVAPVAILQIWFSTVLLEISRSGGSADSLFPTHYWAIIAAVVLAFLALRLLWSRLPQSGTRSKEM